MDFPILLGPPRQRCRLQGDQSQHTGGRDSEERQSTFDPAADRVRVLDVVTGYQGLMNLTGAQDDLRSGAVPA
jgi:hypothetical protein